MVINGMSFPGEGFWKAIDRIYCISVDVRQDRRESAKAQFRRIGILPRVEFVIVTRHSDDPEQGIFESHLDCLRRGLDAGSKHLAVFEDDIVFDRYSTETCDNCARFLVERSDWDILFLGCLVSANRKTGNPSILKIKYRSLAHGYILTRGFAKQILELPWRGISFDEALKDLQGRYYAVYPSIAFQSNARTDNFRYLKLDRFRRMCGGMLRIQKRNEFFHRNRPLIIALHLVVLLSLALFIV